MNFCVPELLFCVANVNNMAAADRKLKIYITPQYTTLECNSYVVIVSVSMKNDKSREKIHIEEL
jgi:hypothetical protein